MLGCISRIVKYYFFQYPYCKVLILQEKFSVNMQYSADFLNYQSNVNEDGSFKRAGLKVLVIEDDKIIQLGAAQK